MSKKVFFSLLVVFSTQIFANSEINLGGANDTLELRANENIFREVVSYEPYETTCYREVYNGTRTECDTVYENKCTKKPYECHEEPIEICREVADTTTEAYSCTEYRRVVDHVYDYTIFANITVVKNASAKNFDLNACSLGVELNETGENFYAKCLNSIVRLKTIDRIERMNGRNKERAIKVELDFSSIEELNALKHGLNNLAFSNNVLSFSAGDLQTARNFRLDIKLIRKRFLLKDITLLDQELKNGDFSIVAQPDGSFLTSIDLKKLAPKFNSKRKNKLTLSLKTISPVDVKGAINSPVLSNELSETRTINE